jgi:hypothetical protein
LQWSNIGVASPQNNVPHAQQANPVIVLDQTTKDKLINSAMLGGKLDENTRAQLREFMQSGGRLDEETRSKIAAIMKARKINNLGNNLGCGGCCLCAAFSFGTCGMDADCSCCQSQGCGC